MIVILHYALPSVLLHALKEQGQNYALRPAEDGEALNDGHLLLLGIAADAPARLAAWRNAGLRFPVLLLGAPQPDWPVAETLSPPFKLGLLVERIAHYAQWTAHWRDPVIIWEKYRLDRTTKALSLGSASQNLTDKEIELLFLLMQEPERAWTRDDLLRKIWGYDSTLDTHTLETHIYRLRRKLTELGGKADIVTGSPGYRLRVL